MDLKHFDLHSKKYQAQIQHYLWEKRGERYAVENVIIK